MTGSCFVTGKARIKQPLSNSHTDTLQPPNITTQSLGQPWKEPCPKTRRTPCACLITLHKKKIIIKRYCIIRRHSALTNLERSWGCKKGKQRTRRTAQRPETRLSQRGSWGPTCWRKPDGSASTPPCCGSAWRPRRASRSPTAPPPAASLWWWRTGPARHWRCLSSST